MRLFHVPTSRSTRVLWALEEIGAPYEVVTMTWEERKGEEHRRRHPLGKVPAFEFDDGQVLFESAAICLQLADLYPEAGLMPALGSDARGRAYQWVSFELTEMEKVVFPWNRARRGGEDETEHAEKFAPVGEALRASLATNAWIAGDDFTLADILGASILRNALALGLLADDDPLRDWAQRAYERPASKRADAVDADRD